LVVSYGAGRDSTALIIELWRRKIRPDAIVFANVGSEKEDTYRFVPVFNRWLSDHDFPRVTVVAYQPVHAPYRSLEGNMILNATLPGATFNRHTCTMKFKVQPQNRWTQHWAPAQRAWAAGQKVTKLIGFEAGEDYRLRRADARAHSGKADPVQQRRYEYQFPLMDWGYDLEKCLQIITDAGLPLPPKSACYFCPNQKPEEVRQLSPEDRSRVMLMELVAEPYNRKVRGLWRRPRKADGRPGSITEYILQEGLPFVPLTALGQQVVLNPKAAKARTGCTFDPPHVGPRLRELLIAPGHGVPEVVTEGDPDCGLYQEDFREVLGPEVCQEGCADMVTETEAHLDLVEAI
jgi:3'-phosphoadenosine 5'-phosphosulfate sulfotransferase (PAPS reductase)/FAD synthetase